MIQFYRRFDARKIKLFVFDLDGTLIDSRLDLIHSVNAMMRHLDRPELPGDVVASYVGDGAPMLVRRALGDPDDQALLDRGLQYFLEYYRDHKLDYTHLYDGVKEALAAILRSQNGHPRHMAVLTNKPVNPSRAIVDALGIADFFTSVYGGNSFPTKKPDPQGLLTILEENEFCTRGERDDWRFLHRRRDRPQREFMDVRSHLRFRPPHLERCQAGCVWWTSRKNWRRSSASG